MQFGYGEKIVGSLVPDFCRLLCLEDRVHKFSCVSYANQINTKTLKLQIQIQVQIRYRCRLFNENYQSKI